MKLLSGVILLGTFINLINGAPEIKSADPSQRFERPAFLTVQEQRYAEAVKDLHRPEYRPLRVRVITPRTQVYESRGTVSNRPVTSSPATRYETSGSKQFSRQPVIPQRTDRHENYGRGNQLSPVIPQKTDRHENYGRGNQLSPAIPQKTDRHGKQNEDIGRNEKLYSHRTENLRSRSRVASNDPDSAVEELWSSRDGSVKSEIIDTRLKLTKPRYIDGVKG